MSSAASLNLGESQTGVLRNGLTAIQGHFSDNADQDQTVQCVQSDLGVILSD